MKLKYLHQAHVVRDPVVRNVDKWYAITPEQLLLFEHRLPAKPMIFDIGGYTGEAAAEILARYPDATLHIFEPLAKYVTHLQKRFKGKKNVHIHAYGIGVTEGEETFYHHGEGSSAYRPGGEAETIIIHDIAKILPKLAPKGVNLLMLNAEGIEYDLLNHLLKHGLMKRIDTLLIQFHTIMPQYRARYAALKKSLAKTHGLVFRVPYVWEKWVRNP